MPDWQEGSLPSEGSWYSAALALGMPAERLVDKGVDPDSHNLHAGVGERCMICDRVIRQGRWVRRTISGGYVHDVC